MGFVHASVPVYGAYDSMSAAEWVYSANTFMSVLAQAGLTPAPNTNTPGGFAGQTTEYTYNASGEIISASGNYVATNAYSSPLGYRVYDLRATLGIYLRVEFILIRQGTNGTMFGVRYAVGYATTGTGFSGQWITANSFTGAANGADIDAITPSGSNKLIQSNTVKVCLTNSAFWVGGANICKTLTDSSHVAIVDSVSPYNFVFMKSINAPTTGAIVLCGPKCTYSYGNIYGANISASVGEWGLARSWFLDLSAKSFQYKNSIQYLAPLPEYGVLADNQGVLISQAYATENSQRLDYDLGFIHRGSVTDFQEIPLNLTGLGVKKYMVVKSFAPFRYTHQSTPSNEFICLVLPME